MDMPELEGDADQAEGDNSDEDDEMVIEDVSEGELQEVSEPEKTPPPLPPTLVKDSIPCPTKSCMHRKINKRTKKSSKNNFEFEYKVYALFESRATAFPHDKKGYCLSFSL